MPYPPARNLLSAHRALRCTPLRPPSFWTTISPARNPVRIDRHCSSLLTYGRISPLLASHKSGVALVADSLEISMRRGAMHAPLSPQESITNLSSSEFSLTKDPYFLIASILLETWARTTYFVAIAPALVAPSE